MNIQEEKYENSNDAICVNNSHEEYSLVNSQIQDDKNENKINDNLSEIFESIRIGSNESFHFVSIIEKSLKKADISQNLSETNKNKIYEDLIYEKKKNSSFAFTINQTEIVQSLYLYSEENGKNIDKPIEKLKNSDEYEKISLDYENIIDKKNEKSIIFNDDEILSKKPSFEVNFINESYLIKDYFDKQKLIVNDSCGVDNNFSDEIIIKEINNNYHKMITLPELKFEENTKIKGNNENPNDINCPIDQKTNKMNTYENINFDNLIEKQNQIIHENKIDFNINKIVNNDISEKNFVQIGMIKDNSKNEDNQAEKKFNDSDDVFNLLQDEEDCGGIYTSFILDEFPKKVDIQREQISQSNSSYNSKLFDCRLQIQNKNVDNNDYLEVIDFDLYSQDPKTKQIFIKNIFYEKEIIDKDPYTNSHINDIFEFLKSKILLEEGNNFIKVGVLQNFTNYMQMKKISVIKDLNNNEELYKIFKTRYNLFRTIFGDGNCFYRAFLFQYLEDIIYKNNSNILLLLISDFKNTLNIAENQLLFANYKIKKESTILGLYIVYKLMTDNNFQFSIFENNFNNLVSMPITFLMMMFNCDKYFDLGLILYLRIKIKNFIEQNKTKLYSKDFPENMGILLPDKYITDNFEFNWEEFYKENLLKLYTEAENIIIYVIPYIFKVNLNIYTYDIGKTIQEKSREIPSYLPNKNTITVFYRSMHYEIIYLNSFYQENFQILNKGHQNLNNVFRSVTEYKKRINEIYNSRIFKRENFLIFDNSNDINQSIYYDKNPYEKNNIFDNNIENIDNNQKKNINQEIEHNYVKPGDDKNLYRICDEKHKVKNDEEAKFFCEICRLKIVKNKILDCNQERTNYLQYNFNYICKECLEIEVIFLLTLSYENSKKLKQNKLYSTFISLQKINHDCKFDVYESNVKIYINSIDLKINDKFESFKFHQIRNIINKNELTIFNLIKSYFCIYCNKQREIFQKNDEKISKVKNILPCKCYYCDVNCLLKYFDESFQNFDNTIKNNFYNFSCICGFTYNIRQLYNLIDLIINEENEFKNSNIKKEDITSLTLFFQIEKYMQTLIRKKFSKFCCRCKSFFFNHIKKMKLFIKTDLLFTKFKSGKFKNLKFFHYICFACLNDVLENLPQGLLLDNNKLKYLLQRKEINCEICDENHLIEDVYYEEGKTNEIRSTELECNII